MEEGTWPRGTSRLTVPRGGGRGRGVHGETAGASGQKTVRSLRSGKEDLSLFYLKHFSLSV